jgi:hypothetical protein
MAEKPLDCLTDSVQYPLATPSKHYPLTKIVRTGAPNKRTSVQYSGIGCRFGNQGIACKSKGATEAAPLSPIPSVTLCLCGEKSP